MSETEPLDMLLLDGRHLLWRAASVFGDLSIDTNDGEMRTGGMYGFLRIGLTAWQKFGGVVMVAWDSLKGPTGRQAIFPEYKRKARSETPRGQEAATERELMLQDMRAQESRLKDLLPILGIRQASAEGWEADDVIAAMCHRFPSSRIGILSGDRDLLQLVNENVMLIRPQPKGMFKLETTSSVKDEWGIEPQQILDLKALAGDPGDNIPGARGIGPKTAAKLILQHGGWETALQHALSNEAKERWQKLLVEHADRVRMSAKLAALNPHVHLSLIPAKADRKQSFIEMSRLKFQSLLADGRHQALLRMGQAGG